MDRMGENWSALAAQEVPIIVINWFNGSDVDEGARKSTHCYLKADGNYKMQSRKWANVRAVGCIESIENRTTMTMTN